MSPPRLPCATYAQPGTGEEERKGTTLLARAVDSESHLAESCCSLVGISSCTAAREERSAAKRATVVLSFRSIAREE